MLKEQTEIHLGEEGFGSALLAESTPGTAFYGTLLEGAESNEQTLVKLREQAKSVKAGKTSNKRRTRKG
jgi:hypothetical protein